MKAIFKYFSPFLIIFLCVAGCKNRNKVTVFTTEDVNPYVKGSLFYKGESGYSISLPRLQWIVVRNSNNKIDLTLQNRIYPATVKVMSERKYKKNISLENAIQNVFKHILINNYKIISL